MNLQSTSVRLELSNGELEVLPNSKILLDEELPYSQEICLAEDDISIPSEDETFYNLDEVMAFSPCDMESNLSEDETSFIEQDDLSFDLADVLSSIPFPEYERFPSNFEDDRFVLLDNYSIISDDEINDIDMVDNNNNNYF